MVMPTAVIAIARSQIGTTEHPDGSNCNPYSQALGRPCEYWCADFVSWVLREAAVDPRPNTASTRALRDWYKAQGRFDMRPQNGDVGLMHLTGRNGPGQPDHVGIVTGYNPDSMIVHTIEGNTSSSDAGSQDNGGGVFAKQRRIGLFVGFGHPHYTEEEDLTPEEHDALVRIDADTDPIPAMNAAIGRIETAVTQPGGAPSLSDADVERVAKRVCDMLQVRLQS